MVKLEFFSVSSLGGIGLGMFGLVGVDKHSSSGRTIFVPSSVFCNLLVLWIQF
jgi:hypothetical protein